MDKINIGFVKKCEEFIPNCETCSSKKNCFKCESNYYLYDENSDGNFGKCVKCELNLGCVQKNLIFKQVQNDGTGKYFY